MDDAELAALGLRRSDFEAETNIEIWPDNFLSVQIFEALGTQWRVGNSGAVGIDYNVLPFTFKMYEIPRIQWPDIFQCVRIMESEALRAMRED